MFLVVRASEGGDARHGRATRTIAKEIRGDDAPVCMECECDYVVLFETGWGSIDRLDSTRLDVIDA